MKKEQSYVQAFYPSVHKPILWKWLLYKIYMYTLNTVNAINVINSRDKPIFDHTCWRNDELF